MRVLFYTHPFFLEPALEFTRVMAERCEFHLMIEMTPRSLGSLLERAPPDLPAGISDAAPVLGAVFPADVRRFWAGAATARFATFSNARTVHPATIAASRRIVRTMERRAPDAIHLDDGSLRLAMARPWLPRIALMNVHDPVPHEGDPNRRVDLGRRLTAGRVDRYRLHSEAFRRAFAARAGVEPGRVDIAPLGIYDVLRAWLPAGVARDARTVLFAGRIAEYKGLDVLYAAAPLVAARVPDVRFVVAGRAIGGYRPPTAPDLPRGGRVEVLAGHVPNGRLATLHAEAAVVVCPYRHATQSGVIPTAYAFGTPVVATTVGGLPDQVDDGVTGLLVAPNDPVALAEAIVRLLTDAPLRAGVGDGIESLRTGRLAWDAIAETVLRSYRVALAGRSDGETS
jgi:starch synthase